MKVHLALLAIAAPAVPSGALLILGAKTGQVWWSWSALSVAAVTGAGLAVVGLTRATARLERRQVEVLRALAAT